MTSLAVGLGLPFVRPATGPAPVTLPSNWRLSANFSSAIQDTYDTWSGAPADALWMTTQHTSWAAFDAGFALSVAEFEGDTRPIIWSLPLSVDGTSLASVAGGSNDANFIDGAEAMLAAAPNDNSAIIVRLGWEANFTIDSSPAWAWTAVGVEADYIAAFRRVHGLLRGVSDRFMFDWCLNSIQHSDSYDPSTFYPGDDYVDIIGVDVYYRALRDSPTDVPTNPDPVGVWNYVKETLTYGLDWIVAFAGTHGKPMSVPEWGVEWEKPQWVELMSLWIESINPVYHAYFDNNVDPSHQTRISDGSKGLAGHAYLMHFGTDVPTYGAAAIAGATVGVIGSGGALPTGWGNFLSNVAIEVVDTPVVDGVACLALRVSASSTGSDFTRFPALWLPFNYDGSGPSAAQNEIWRFGVAAKIQSNTGAGATFYGAKLIELDGSVASNGSTDDYPAVSTYDTMPVYANHFNVMRKIVEADTASVVSELDIFLNAAATPSSSVVLIAAPVLTETL